MNRKIASQGGVPGDDFDIERKAASVPATPRPGLKGTAIQQCWQILNFHELRLNKVDTFLAQSSRETVSHMQAISTQASKSMSNEKRVAVLEAQVIALRGHIATLTKTSQKKSKGGSVQLEVSDTTETA